jgi:hypothetical protein
VNHDLRAVWKKLVLSYLDIILAFEGMEENHENMYLKPGPPEKTTPKKEEIEENQCFVLWTN